MSEMTSVEHQQQQDQQYVGALPNTKYHCKDCNVYFDSNKSLEVHLHYQHDRLMGQWVNQDESNNNNNNNNNTSKSGNHNSHNIKRESITAPADSSESSVQSRPQSAGPATSHQQQHHQPVSSQVPQQQPPLPPPLPPPQPPNNIQSGYPHFQMSMFGGDPSYFVPNEQSYILPHPYSPTHDDHQNSSVTNYPPRFHPYPHHHHHPQHQQHHHPQQQQQQQQPPHHFAERANSVSSTSPRSPLQCDKCGGVFDDANQLGEHVRSSHPTSPIGYPGQPQYQQLGGSPQNQQQVPSSQTQQIHSSPPQSSQGAGQTPYEYNGGVSIKTEIKQEQEEQSEILDLDSHKVQTHRYEEEIMRIQQQQHQEMQMHQQHQALQQQQQQQQRVAATHSVSSMLGWPPAQPHEYHPGLSPMGGPMDSSSPDQSQFIRNQHMPVVEPPRHAVSPIITSTQTLGVHQMSAGLLQANQKGGGASIGNQSWKSNEARRPKTYNCTACNKWFTSSGHLKRHYNTTLHKNAVKQSNLPDPANMPISAHHHPGRDSHGHSNRANNNNNNHNNGSGVSRSPELSTSVSPPNLMAGPSVEAARGLLHTPTTNNHFTTSNSSSNSSTNSNDSTSQIQQQPQPPQQHHHHQHHQSQQQQPQPQQQQQQQQQQQASSTTATHMVALNSPVSSPMAVHHHQQMAGSPSPQLTQQQQQHHLSIGSPSQLVSHHPMNSPMSHQHLNSPSPMVATSTTHHHHHLHPHHHHHHQQQQQQHMNSPSPIMAGVPSMVSPPMGGITMPHQPYPNGLPPHVTTTTSIPGLLESITSPQTTTGNNNNNNNNNINNINNNNDSNSKNNNELPSQSNLHIAQDMLPGFGTFSNNQRTLPSFTQFIGVAGYVVGQIQSEAVIVGGLSPEDDIPQDRTSYEANGSNYDHQQYHHHHQHQQQQQHFHHIHHQEQDEQQQQQRSIDDDSPRSYQEPMSNMMDPLNSTSPDDRLMMKQYDYLPQQQQQQQQQQQGAVGERDEQSYEANNNNLPSIQGKEEVNPNVVGKKRGRGRGAGKNKTNISNKIKKKEQDQVSSTNSVGHFISEGGIHKCIDCNKNFNKACYLTQHNKSFHSGDKPFKCNQCGKRFPLEYMHEEHLLKHAGEKPYKCGECPKQFNHKTDLRRHQCLHTGEKPYACDTCGKGFIRKDHMMKHLDTHKKKQIHNIHLRT